jgi:hypothetical protein
MADMEKMERLRESSGIVVMVRFSFIRNLLGGTLYSSRET